MVHQICTENKKHTFSFRFQSGHSPEEDHRLVDRSSQGQFYSTTKVKVSSLKLIQFNVLIFDTFCRIAGLRLEP